LRGLAAARSARRWLLVAACPVLGASAKAVAAQDLPGVGVEASASAGGAAIRSAVLVRASSPTGGVAFQTAIERTRLVRGSAARVVDMASVRTGPSLEWRGALLDGGASVWLEGLRPAHFGGFATVRWPAGPSPLLAVTVARVPIWRSAGGTDPLRPLRVRDLDQLDRRLGATEARVSFSTKDSSTELEAGTTRYGDGNRRAFASVRVGLPLSRGRGWAVVLAPTAYMEASSRSTRGFLTPSRYLSAGVAVDVTTHVGAIAIAGSAHPHLYHRVEGVGPGVDGRITGALPLRTGALELSAQFMRQGAYRFVQVAAGARVDTP
jgi:hypothetical protein